jgi:hypothetical protein
MECLTILVKICKEYSNEMGETLVDPLEEEFQVDELEEVDNLTADWESHLRL